MEIKLGGFFPTFNERLTSDDINGREVYYDFF
jgi:hypothetical protein